MKKLLIILFFSAISSTAICQNSFITKIIDSKTGRPLIGATVKISALNKAGSTDQSGQLTFVNIPDGKQMLAISYVGYVSKVDSVFLPLFLAEPVIFVLESSEGEELEEIIVSTTRSSRTIDNIPTRIEVIAGEELEEKGNMKPGDIRMILNESTGIQTQQTSATSANASIRIQGLDGRYTQILKDGFPLFSGAASGLGLLQTPPLDLKQVEVIKGSASTLYGGGAIAGLVNLISKIPGEDRELNFQLNGTSAGGLDLNGFYGEKFGNVGMTIFASRNSNSAYAPGNVVFTAIPEFTRYTFNPKLFLDFDNKTSLEIGMNSSFEDRTGGDLRYIEDGGDATRSFFENNNTDRLSSQLSLKHRLNDNSELILKNSLNYFNRKINIPGYVFDGLQKGSFSELGFFTGGERAEWVAGINLWTDQFRENLKTAVPLRDYNQTTFGAFIQNNIHASNWLELETGLRSDYVLDYGFSLLPRLSALIKINNKLNSRIGGGLGYKTPTIFTEESERIQYQNVLPVSSEFNRLERSYGANWDINYKTTIKDVISLSINHLFFYTLLDNPLVMEQFTASQLRFTNSSGYMDTKGLETNVKLTYEDFKLFLGYSLTDAKIRNNGISRDNPLTSKHRLNNVLMYEADEKWKLGIEAYYYSKQTLNDGTKGKPYWIFGFMAERLWEQFSLYINFENFTDTRQTRFDNIYSGSISNPVFRDIYAPLDGFVINGGLKIRL